MRVATSMAAAIFLYSAQSVAQDHLKVVVYIHDDVPSHIAAQPQGYFEPWEAEMAAIQPFPIRVEYKNNLPGVTDIEYAKADARYSLQSVENALSKVPLEGHPRRTLRLMLTGKNPSPEAAGVAKHGHSVALASVESYAFAGHELGHLLTATHEASEVRFNGWACETYMTPQRHSIRSNCYRYSDENRAKIADHIHARF